MHRPAGLLLLASILLSSCAVRVTGEAGFGVLSVGPLPESKEECKDDGWRSFGDEDGPLFRNQGECVSFVETGKLPRR